jgi:hypothetical protein
MKKVTALKATTEAITILKKKENSHLYIDQEYLKKLKQHEAYLKREKERKKNKIKIYKKSTFENFVTKRPQVISRNRILCNNCFDIIESKHSHHHVTCKCGRVSIDGGNDCLKRTFMEEGDYTDFSEVL